MSTSQKIIKNLAIALAIILIANIFSAFYHIVNFMTDLTTTSKEEEKSLKKDYLKSFSELEIDMATANILIKEGPNFKIENNNKQINIKEKNNKLFIKEQKKEYFINKTNPSKLIIQIPKNTTLTSVDITNAAGNIKIDSLVTEKLDLEQGAGNLTIDNLVVKESTSIESGAGKVNIYNGKITNLELEIGVGEFNLNSILTGTSKIEAGVGELNINLLDNSDNYTFSVEKGLGAIKINNNLINNTKKYKNGPNLVKIEGGIGKIFITSSDYKKEIK